MLPRLKVLKYYFHNNKENKPYLPNANSYYQFFFVNASVYDANQIVICKLQYDQGLRIFCKTLKILYKMQQIKQASKSVKKRNI